MLRKGEFCCLTLQMDEPYEGADHDWEWTPVSGNIMYAMPEKGNTVRLYFGSGTASEGTAASDIRGNGESMPGQQKRTFTTATGKKMELHPEHLSMQGGGGQTDISDGQAVSFESMTKAVLTASGPVRLEAATIRAYTPQEINMYRSRARCEEKGKDIIPNGTKSNPPTGTGDAGFTFNYEFNALSSVNVLCGTDFIRYKPYEDDPEETEPDDGGFSWGKLAGHCLAGLAVVGAVAVGAGYLASIVFTGGATAAFAPWVVGGLAGLCGTAAVGGMAANDIRRGEVSGLDDYMLTGLISSTEGAVAGAAFCMVPYASEVVLAQVVPYGMTGIFLPAGVFVSGETIMTATMLTGYTVTFSNMAVKVNDSMVGLAGRNMMADAMGQENYQQVKDISAMGSNTVLMMGLSNPRLYGTNNNNAGNIRENASYQNGKTNFENETPRSGEEWEAFFKEKYGSENVVWESRGSTGGFRELMTPEEVARYDNYWNNVADDMLKDNVNGYRQAILNGEISKTTGGKINSKVITAAIDTNTGDIYNGISGMNNNPTRNATNPQMQAILDRVGSSMTNYPLENCGEFNAINNALNNGVDASALRVYSIERSTGAYKTPCINCQTLYGDIVHFTE